MAVRQSTITIAYGKRSSPVLEMIPKSEDTHQPQVISRLQQPPIAAIEDEPHERPKAENEERTDQTTMMAPS
jgi:hypothetical protein